MLSIRKNINLQPFNTFRIAAKARFFTTINTPADLSQLQPHLKKYRQQILILGHGANILFTKNYPSLVIKNNLSGKKVLHETKDAITLELGSGENWHELVMWAAAKNLSGMENMALIPGTIGGAATQNIAAYGQSFEETFVSLSAINLSTNSKKTFSKKDCRFSYRDSIFKRTAYRNYFVTSVIIRLSKKPKLQTSYHSRYARESLVKILSELANPPYSPLDIARAVITLRRTKLPDWKKIGTAGSFFRNPVVTKRKLVNLQSKISDLQFYPVEKLSYPFEDDIRNQSLERLMIPAGRLLDELGWRGKRIGWVGTYSRQALAIINRGKATGGEIQSFAKAMQDDVWRNYRVRLEPEVNII